MSYTNTFITVAPDCPVDQSEIPVSNRAQKPVHLFQYELLTRSPYTFTHEDLIFATYLAKEGIDHPSADEKKLLWNQLFSKGHPCLRASALTKRYGFGAHYNDEGKIALVPMESVAYRSFVSDGAVKKLPAMRRKRKN